MLIGEYVHTLDAKKRVSLPVKFRKELGKKIVATRGLDACLFLYSLSEWKKISEKIGELGFGQADTRGFNRFFLSGAADIALDGAGRILVPEYLRRFAGLSDRAVFAGVHNRVELWDEERWRSYTARIESQADVLAERLGDLGAV